MKVKLHFVGKRLYDKEVFRREAIEYGVNRAMPISVAKTLKYGEKILLAQYEDGKANVFGYFTYTRLSVENSKTLKELLKYVKPVDVVFKEEYVNRICGTYTIIAEYYFDAQMCEILFLIEEIAKDLKEKVKVFIGGDYFDLPEFVIEDVKFTRSITEVEVPDALFDEDVEEFLSEVWRMDVFEDYNQRRYLTNKAKKTLPLTLFG